MIRVLVFLAPLAYNTSHKLLFQIQYDQVFSEVFFASSFALDLRRYSICPPWAEGILETLVLGLIVLLS